MVLDHVRDYLTNARFDLGDLTRTNLALFGTRWITHFCAPIFIFLAGSQRLDRGHPPHPRRARPIPPDPRALADPARAHRDHLRLVLLHPVECRGASAGDLGDRRIDGGACRADLLAAHRDCRVRAAAGAGAQSARRDHPESLGALAPLWRVLHVPGPLEVLPVFIRYPLVPWVGVMALGYVAGPAIFSQDPRVSRRLAWVGGLLALGFVTLRWLNMYGDPHPWIDDGTPAHLVISFLNVTKYPPSLLFLLMTLGPGSSRWPLSVEPRVRLANVFITFGRVPFLFYVTHLYLVHALAIAAGVAQGFPASAIRTIHFRVSARDTGSDCRWSIWCGLGWWRRSTRCAGATPSSRREAGRGGCRIFENGEGWCYPASDSAGSEASLGHPHSKEDDARAEEPPPGSPRRSLSHRK